MKKWHDYFLSFIFVYETCFYFDSHKKKSGQAHSTNTQNRRKATRPKKNESFWVAWMVFV